MLMATVPLAGAALPLWCNDSYSLQQWLPQLLTSVQIRILAASHGQPGRVIGGM